MREPRVKKKVWPETQVLLAIPVVLFVGLFALTIREMSIDLKRTVKPSQSQNAEALRQVLKLYPEAKFKQLAVVYGNKGGWIAFETDHPNPKDQSPKYTIEIKTIEGTDNFLHLVTFNAKAHYVLVSKNSEKDAVYQTGQFVRWLLEEAGLPKATNRVPMPKPKETPLPLGNPPQ